MRRALLPVLLVFVSACSASSAEKPVAPSPVAHTTAAPSPSPAPPALTLDEAAQAFRDHLAVDDVARVTGDERWALELARDGQDLITIAQYRGSRSKPPRYTWGEPTLIVPRQNGRAPLWFAAVAERRAPGEDPRQALLVFVQQGGIWQNSFESLLETDLPEIELDPEGYATALDSRDESIAISPHLMGPLHATVAEEGSGGYASALIEPGPHTTGYHDEIASLDKEFRRREVGYDSIFALAVGFPVFAIRTADGGGLLLYSLTRTTTWTPEGTAQGMHMEIPEAARWTIFTEVIIKERRILETQQYVSRVPPRDSTAPAAIIGYDGLVTRGSVSN
ncbi:hypothetical protein [Acrocarpospora catenulata]|uniref:hypothetical protein n=1 Tax=Acrocarpospora catenulata TaxID=2836182 RepID=UPI001BDA3EF1|nr:hypothetical protein [Acrocarpospora catenulata]